MRFNELSPARQRALLVCIVVILCALLVALAESAVRVRHYLRTGGMWGVDRTFTIDERSGLRIPIPGLVAGPVSINSGGFRGPEIETPKPASRVRIAYLGGSTTYCAEVSSNEHAWPAIVHATLQERFPEVSFDYVNAAVSGFSSETSLRNLEARVAPLQPDLIVIYHGTNDLSANSFELAREAGVVAERTEQRQSWLSRYSMLVYLVEKNLEVMQRQDEAEVRTGKLETTREALVAPFEEDLNALLAAAKRHAPLTAIATFSYRLRREQSPEELKEAAVTSLFYMPYMTLDALLDGFEAYNETILATARRHDALLIEGALDIPGDGEHFTDSVHFTDAGSQAMATRVSDSLIASPRFQELLAARSAR